MAEKTLNENLGGAEIRAIIAQEIENRLKGDCTLGDDLCYAGFTAEFEIKIKYRQSIVKETLAWGTAKGGDSTGAIDSSTTITSTHQSADSPDIERQSHSLPIPVMVSTPAGNERRKVHIAKAQR